MTTATEITDVDKSGELRPVFLKRLPALSAGIFAALAARGTQVAHAGNFACCNLAYPPSTGPWCPIHQYGDFYCPGGTNARVWYCCAEGQLFGCGECTNGATCHDGPWECSYGWNTGVVC